MIKKITIVSLMVLIYACTDNSEKNLIKKVSNTDSTVKYETPKGIVLFKQNCAMCHSQGYSPLIGPPMLNLNYDYFIDYYDGIIKKDSSYEAHKKIGLDKEEWKEIAIQTYGGCQPGSSNYKSHNR